MPICDTAAAVIGYNTSFGAVESFNSGMINLDTVSSGYDGNDFEVTIVDRR
jgi:hypothetical protein